MQRGIKHPPKRLALGLVELRQHEAPDNVVIDAEAKHISACFFDDFGGLVSTLLVMLSSWEVVVLFIWVE